MVVEMVEQVLVPLPHNNISIINSSRIMEMSLHQGTRLPLHNTHISSSSNINVLCTNIFKEQEVAEVEATVLLLLECPISSNSNTTTIISNSNNNTVSLPHPHRPSRRSPHLHLHPSAPPRRPRLI